MSRKSGFIIPPANDKYVVERTRVFEYVSFTLWEFNKLFAGRAGHSSWYESSPRDKKILYARFVLRREPISVILVKLDSA